MSYHLSKSDKDKIESKIKEIELLTQGEIVPCIFTKSDNYPVVAPLFTLILMVLFLFTAIYVIELDNHILFFGALVTIVIGMFLGKIDILKKLFLHPSIMKDEVHQFFVEIFFENKLHYTKDRTGVLIGISLLERRMEILAGKGICEKVNQSKWDRIIQETITDIQKDHLAIAMLEAIDKCGAILIKEFPAQKDNPNEISNKLITDL